MADQLHIKTSFAKQTPNSYDYEGQAIHTGVGLITHQTIGKHRDLQVGDPIRTPSTNTRLPGPTGARSPLEGRSGSLHEAQGLPQATPGVAWTSSTSTPKKSRTC